MVKIPKPTATAIRTYDIVVGFCERLLLPKGSSSLSQKPTTMSYVLIAVAVGLGIFTMVSMIRRGSNGWAWLMWAAVFSLVGYLLYQFLTNSGSSGSSDGG